MQFTIWNSSNSFYSNSYNILTALCPYSFAGSSATANGSHLVIPDLAVVHAGTAKNRNASQTCNI